ncbi:MAG: UvrD-helicase domain-containing protein [Umezawaea sp.]
MDLDGTRKDILAATGHLLVEGGPGCGKTTIALLKASETVETLDSEQRVLFLSFSRAAVRQISDRMQGILSRAARDRLETRTFHAFFLGLVRSHGRLLTGTPSSFITPDREGRLKADFEGGWTEETHRLAREEGRYVFDRLAGTAATLLERCGAVRALYSDTCPLVIVDEFQDANTDQWRAVQALSGASVIVCLADPDQRIYDHIPGVDETRVAQAIEYLRPRTFDLSKDNHRSPGNGLSVTTSVTPTVTATSATTTSEPSVPTSVLSSSAGSVPAEPGPTTEPGTREPGTREPGTREPLPSVPVTPSADPSPTTQSEVSPAA